MLFRRIPVRRPADNHRTISQLRHVSGSRSRHSALCFAGRARYRPANERRPISKEISSCNTFTATRSSLQNNYVNARPQYRQGRNDAAPVDSIALCRTNRSSLEQHQPPASGICMTSVRDERPMKLRKSAAPPVCIARLRCGYPCWHRSSRPGCFLPTRGTPNPARLRGQTR